MGPSTNPALGHFTESRQAHFLIEGLIGISIPSASEVLDEQVRSRGGCCVSSLQITTSHTFVDLLLTVITGGIYAPVTVTFEGDVVK
jgi:hypothetical protein